MKNIFAAILFLVDGSLQAQTQANQALENFNQMLGKWTGTAKCSVQGKDYVFNITLECKKIADTRGYSVEQILTDAASKRTLKKTSIIGYTDADSKIHWFTVDNNRGTQEYTGTWEKSDELSLIEHGIRLEKPYLEKVEITFTSATQLHYKAVGTLDGADFETADGTFTLQPEKKK